MRLQDWCKANDLGHKVLLTDNIKNTGRLTRIANSEGCIVKNLDCFRMEDLAKQIVIEKIAGEGRFMPFEPVDQTYCVLLINQLLLKDAKETKRKYSFIPKECIDMDASREILRVINCLRMGKKTDAYESVVMDGSLTGQKLTQLNALIAAFEKLLSDRNQYDRIRALAEAVKALEEKTGAIDFEVGILDYMEPQMTYLERTFLSNLTDSPVLIECGREAEVDASFYRVYGQANEIQLAIAKIREDALPLGQVNIMYSSQEYENGIVAALKERGIKFNVVTGFSCMDKAYPSLLLDMIDWWREGYSYEAFRPVTSSMLVKFRKDYSFGIKAGIGWGLDRYRMFADKIKNDKAAYTELLQKYNRLPRRYDEKKQPIPVDQVLESYSQYAEWIDKIVALFSFIESTPCDVGKIYRAMISFIENETIEFKMDKPYLKMMKNLSVFFDLYGETENLAESMRVIEEAVSAIEVQDDEKEDAVTVMRIGNVSVLERPYQFCIGLSYEAFMEKAVDSPVLRDSEMTDLLDASAGYVEQVLDRSKQKKEHLLQTIGTMPQGKLYVAACDYDTQNFRALAPSEVYMELMKKYKVSEEEQIPWDYRNDVQFGVNYTVDKTELFKNADREDMEEWEFGYVKIEKNEDGQEIVDLGFISATSLQNLIECPWKFDYMIKHFDWLNKEMSMVTWLTPDVRGTLIHGVLEEYCNARLKGKVLGDEDAPDETELRRLYDSMLREFEIIVPKGSEQAYEVEKDRMWKLLRDYVKKMYSDLKTDTNKWSVTECERKIETKAYYINENGNYVNEKGFPLDEDGNADESQSPCKKMLRYSFTGFIDRIDSYTDDTGEVHVRIIVYKTGKKKTTEERKEKNTELQHYVYALAMSDTIDCFWYEFPFDGNDRLEISAATVKDLPVEVRKGMADVFISGKMEKAADDEDDEQTCKYCDYKPFCIHRMELE